MSEKNQGVYLRTKLFGQEYTIRDGPEPTDIPRKVTSKPTLFLNLTADMFENDHQITVCDAPDAAKDKAARMEAQKSAQNYANAKRVELDEAKKEGERVQKESDRRAAERKAKEQKQPAMAR